MYFREGYAESFYCILRDRLGPSKRLKNHWLSHWMKTSWGDHTLLQDGSANQSVMTHENLKRRDIGAVLLNSMLRKETAEFVQKKCVMCTGKYCKTVVFNLYFTTPPLCICLLFQTPLTLNK